MITKEKKTIVQRVLGEEVTNRLAQNSMYRGMVDGLANNFFSQIYILNEHYIAGMSWEKAVQARIAAFFGNMLTGRPYGIWQDFVHRKLGIKENTHWFKKYVADVVAFATGQSWIYVGYLAAPVLFPEIVRGVSHGDLDAIVNSYQTVNWDAIKAGAIFLTAAAPALGTPQRITYQYVRKQAGLETRISE